MSNQKSKADKLVAPVLVKEPNEIEKAREVLKKDMEENIRLAQIEIQAVLEKRGLKLESVAQTLLVPR